MVKLVGVYQGGKKSRSAECKARRFLPLEVETDLTMVMALDEFCLACGPPNKSKPTEDVQMFLRNYNCLEKDEVAGALMLTWADILPSLGQLITCVGCRRSIENLFHTLQESADDCSIDPLVITADGVLSINRQHIGNPASLANLMCNQVTRLQRQYIDGPATKKSGSKKGGRCAHHTLDQKKVLSGSWLDCWDVMEPECKEEIVLLPFPAIRATLDKYLKKHSFCCECATMINRAYTYLIEEGRDLANVLAEDNQCGGGGCHPTSSASSTGDDESEGSDTDASSSTDNNNSRRNSSSTVNGAVMKNGKPSTKSIGGYGGPNICKDATLNLFAGVSPCVSDKHVHVTCHPSFISQLLLLAEPEMSGLDQERHAKNMETALKEVLTCIGITLFNRFHKIQQRLREGEQTCDLLCYVAFISLRKSLEICVERKRGITDLDALCFQIEQSDRDRERRQARKRERKSKQQQKKKDLKAAQLKEDSSTTAGCPLENKGLKVDKKSAPNSGATCDNPNEKTGKAAAGAVSGKGGGDTASAAKKHHDSGFETDNGGGSRKNSERDACDLPQEAGKTESVGVGATTNNKKKKKCARDNKKEVGLLRQQLDDAAGDSDSGLSFVWSEENSPMYARCEERFVQCNWIKGGSPDLGLGEGVDRQPNACHHSAQNPKTGGSGSNSNSSSNNSMITGTAAIKHHHHHFHHLPNSLADLLEDDENIDENGDCIDCEEAAALISQEEMHEFHCMFPHLHSQRKQLRENLREKFAALCVGHGTGDCATIKNNNKQH
eukprot:TRINITY_DN3477_c0_g1_i10.p1 TRINITY_DN3477_c0_g1~~TRINITY_DN3477_c0_g1_i10.p1  ORF type:complete len:780 (+),score=258.71 TRINITY_DN3477_c0_g1_i10:58-2397(+)